MVRCAGADITKMSERRLRPLRRYMQPIFQDPFGSLNPRPTVRDIVGEAMLVHKLARSEEAMEARVAELLERVGLPADALRRHGLHTPFFDFDEAVLPGACALLAWCLLRLLQAAPGCPCTGKPRREGRKTPRQP
jgi:hypothetical protein